MLQLCCKNATNYVEIVLNLLLPIIIFLLQLCCKTATNYVEIVLKFTIINQSRHNFLEILVVEVEKIHKK